MKDKIINYLKETLAEMRKVVWPDQRYVTVATIIILVLVFITGAFVMIVDFGLAEIFKVLLK
ncbi:MAG: preprotein translocase subunit SecE [Candidatus Margulisbacteria bacterium]|nr:preprotein translocase subunit SecE [Candidatus Margulisiibacteriota bacterium]